jgi:hypothetical protein
MTKYLRIAHDYFILNGVCSPSTIASGPARAHTVRDWDRALRG